ncbi:MAG TPA: signal recognition particle-docking protein FtsY [Polaromonas sp.]|uniref:signal recognition particle-docking protein FtsY n=1 Tax=Polaromonas sp. TaxID=1869339 RepID=UPI002D64ADF6|nr:signal recognition particle-docking protein FtsY [Polaromonas sp.]HYW58539.1 signal recognition particle-docking protein FtsY [Polaromonas sp.]
MFSFFKKKKPDSAPPPASIAPSPPPAPLPPVAATGGLIGSALVTPIEIPLPGTVLTGRENWVSKLRSGLNKTGASISGVFTGTRIDDALYEDLESALLMADTGVSATTHLIEEVKQRVKDSGVTHPVAVKNILTEALTQLLKPLEQALVIGEHKPTVIMVAGVNGAGKTTSIGKLTRHLASEGASVLLAAADTFRAAAREQLEVWADRNTVEIISQEGGDPAAVSFDAVSAGKARGKDVVLVDTAGRLPTQLHLMEELRKIKRVVSKADATAPHEVLLVIDGNTGQNALSQVKAFDEILQLTGLIVTKLDGTAKGGVLAAIALWARERSKASPSLRPVPVYFIGVGEKLEDLETFNAREFAQALLA